ncbi:uncharacterized protein [Rutidosis leptorrhynchoides]|uniref:uncharacterized protein n=1 Tax=Rutidosis leptorrhynchoides TaxID=125765 RepID=UPI003A9A3267
MIKGRKNTVLTVAEKCKTILASNWQGTLNTVKADAKGSKEEIYSSKVKYFVKRGRPYIWVPEDDLHNVNTLIDERGSFAVTSTLPGSLASLLQSLKKPPNRVALVGEVVPLGDTKLKSAAESLREMIISEGDAIKKFSYAVSGILRSSDFASTSRAENLVDLLKEDQQYMVYKFSPRVICSKTHMVNGGKATVCTINTRDNFDPQGSGFGFKPLPPLADQSKVDSAGRVVVDSKDDSKAVVDSRVDGRIVVHSKWGIGGIEIIHIGSIDVIRSKVVHHNSISYIESKGSSHEVDLKDMEESKADPLSIYSASLIDGINQNEARRRALMIICAAYLNKNVKDARVLSIDRKGVDLLGKVVGPVMDDGSREYQWKEMRLSLEEDACDVETFCKRLVEMEGEAIKNVSAFSGLPLQSN